jgi:hypothetical protein
MAHELKTEVDGDILRVTASGTRDPETVAAVAHEIAALCSEKGIPKALIDVSRLEGKLGTLDAFSLVVKHFPALRELSQLEGVAVLDKELTEERHRFLENVAVNRGFNIRMFDDADKAMEWLRSEPDA